jgi:hypothetical protein
VQILNRVLFVGVLCLFVTGCSGGYIANYEIGLFETDRPVDAQEKYGKHVIRTIEDADKEISHFEDDMISVVFEMKPKVFEVEIFNKLDRPIAIDWDGAQYVDENGTTHRLVSESVLKKDLDKPQEPQVIEGGDQWHEKVQSRDNLKLEEGIHTQWIITPFFPYKDKSSDKLTGKTEGLKDKVIKIKLPFKVDGEFLDYTFGFMIQKITVEKASPEEEDDRRSTNYHDQFEHSE